MVYKVSAPLHIFEKLEIIEGHTFFKLEEAHTKIEESLKSKGIQYTKQGNGYLNESNSQFLEIVKQ